MIRLVAVAIVALAVAAFAPTAGAAGAVSAAGATVAVALTLVGAHHRALPLVGAALAVVLVGSADLTSGGAVQRWPALAAMPLIVPLSGLSLVRLRTVATVIVLAPVVLAGSIRVLAYDPLRDAACGGCLPLPAVLGHHATTSWGVLVGGGVALGGLAFALPSSRQRVMLAVVVALGGWSLVGWQQPRGGVVEASLWAFAVAILAGVVQVAKSLSDRVRLARLAELLRGSGGPQSALRQALGDPSATLAFATDRGWINPDGVVCEPLGRGRATTSICFAETVVARISHVPDSGKADTLAGSLSPELRISIEQARLDALLRAQLRELQESRLRVVEAADDQRRRVERNLHDGAQQQVLALGFDIRGALAATPNDATLQQCLASVMLVLRDLRALARGVYPALLTGAGLGPALDQLGREVTVSRLPARRFAPGVERTVYLLVSEWAAHGPVEVTADATDQRLRVRVRGGQRPANSVVTERVRALGGTVSSSEGSVEVRIPCV